MTDDPRKITEAALARLARPLRLTAAGLVAERLVRAFWPLTTILLIVAAALGFGLQDVLPPVAKLAFGGVAAFAAIAAAVRGLARFRWPTAAEARARLDETAPGRPIAALTDVQALGGADAGSSAVWRAHLARMAARAAALRPPAPDLRLSARDRYGLRYAALTAFAMALLFGVPARMADVGALGPAGGEAIAAAGPSWEGWVEPPAYTGRPSLYLNAIDADLIEVPQGSRFSLRFYGAPGAIGVEQTVGDAPPAPADGGAAAAPVQSAEFVAMQSGEVRVTGPGGRSLGIEVLPDLAPHVAFAGQLSREADGQMTQAFTADDDFQVTGGRAEFTLDLDAMDRRFGLAVAPEPREPYVLDLPLPISGDRAHFTESLVDNASKHLWANMPVKLTLEVQDGLGQTGRSDTLSLVLPGRKFYDPLAAALIEMRRDLLWSGANGPRAVQILRAVSFRPEDVFRNHRAYLMLRVAMRRFEAALTPGPLTAEARDEMAEALWEIAVLIEDGGLSDALERMQRAQERLSEAIRNGASPEDIQALMDELKAATDAYIRQLAERGETDPSDQFAQQQGQQITGDQIQQLMDQIQKLMEEGRMAEAQELLEQLNRLMQNLRVTQGPGGSGNSPGAQAMQGLADTLRDQQDLSDETFQDLQQPGTGEQQGQQQGQGRGRQGDVPDRQQGLGQGQSGEAGPEGDGQNGDGQGTQDPGETGQGGQTLAERQQALRQGLNGQMGNLPGAGSAEGDAARRALDQAGRAMRDAEEALRDGDQGQALDRQAEAIEQLREGMRNLGEALAQQQRPGQSGNQASNDPTRQGQGQTAQRDPLGRIIGQTGRMGTDENMLQGEDVYRRARDLLDEIRRRSGDLQRPPVELDYLKRLLDRF